MICELHRKDLAGSGINEDWATVAGLRCAGSLEVKDILGFDPKSGGMVIAYPGTNGKQAPFVRIKPDRPFLDRYGKPSKYLSPKGSGNRLYIPPGIESILNDHKTPLWITEGEKKALKACQEGLHCIAVPGVWAWRQRTTSTRSTPIPDLDLIQCKGRTINLVFDSDLRANKQVATALYELSKELERRGANVSQVNLPDGPHGAKCGLDDYLLTHSLESFCAIEPSPVLPPEFAYIEINTVPDFVKKILPNREAIIEHGILHPKSRIGITGPGKALKSMFTQNLILSISAGIPLLGFRIPKPRRVMYVQSEVSAHAMQDRFARMIAGQPNLSFAQALLVNAHSLKIDTKEGFKTIEYLIERSQTEIVVFDPLYKLHTKDENRSEQMREIMDLFDRLIEKFGVAIGAVHHHAKGTEGKDDGQLARGSTIFGDWVDTQLVIKGTPENRYQKRLSFVMRNDAEPDPMQIVLDPDTLWFRSATGEETHLKSQTEAENVRDAAQAIFNDGHDVDAKALSIALGVSVNTAKTRMKWLERYDWSEAKGAFGKVVFRPKSVKSSIDRLYEVDRP